MSVVNQKQETKKVLPEIVKRQSSFKLTVTEELERTIRYYIDRFPTTEYSGTLFYKVNGDFEKGDLEIEAIDFLLQDIGTAGSTEFYQSPDVAHYIVSKEHLMEDGVFQGLMHSHHTMGAYFSSIDTSTLRAEGADRTHFVSLVVDTKGTYVAAITRRVKEEMEAKGKVTYSSFNEESKHYTKNYKFSRELIEYFDLKVSRPEVPNLHQELSDRIAEVKKQKEEKAKAARPTYQYPGNTYGNRSPYFPSTTPTHQATATVVQTTQANKAVNHPNTPVQRELPFENEEFDWTDVANGGAGNTEEYTYAGVVNADTELIEGWAKQLVSGSVCMVDDGNTSLENLAITMNAVFKTRFPDFTNFQKWADSFVDFIVGNAEDDSLVQMGMKDADVMEIVAHDIKERLSTVQQNEYIVEFMELLDGYLVFN